MSARNLLNWGVIIVLLSLMGCTSSSVQIVQYKPQSNQGAVVKFILPENQTSAGHGNYVTFHLIQQEGEIEKRAHLGTLQGPQLITGHGAIPNFTVNLPIEQTIYLRYHSNNGTGNKFYGTLPLRLSRSDYEFKVIRTAKRKTLGMKMLSFGLVITSRDGFSTEIMPYEKGVTLPGIIDL